MQSESLIVRNNRTSIWHFDVLPEREYSESHIPGAVNIPLKDLTADTAVMLRRDKPVVVY